MRPYNVLHITQALGGVQTFLQLNLRNDPTNYTVYSILSPENNELRKMCHERGINFFPIKISRGVNPFTDAVALVKMIRHIRKINPDVVHCHSAKGGFLGRLACRLTGKKVIFTPHAFSFLPFTGFKRIIFYRLERIARRWTDILLAVSHSEALRAKFEVGFDEAKIRVVLNSVHVHDNDCRDDFSKASEIKMIGRLTHQKNPLLFLKIANLFKGNPNVTFSILGAGHHDHLINEINEYLRINDLTDRVKLLNWGDTEASKKFIESADVFVMTSVFEGLPYSLLEAMAKGIPCVVSKCDGNNDVIQNGENGFACITENQFAEKIKLLLEDESLRRKIGVAGFNYVRENHNIEHAVKDLEKIYLELAAKK